MDSVYGENVGVGGTGDVVKGFLTLKLFLGKCEVGLRKVLDCYE